MPRGAESRLWGEGRSLLLYRGLRAQIYLSRVANVDSIKKNHRRDPKSRLVAAAPSNCGEAQCRHVGFHIPA